jgi:hypothetical protein
MATTTTNFGWDIPQSTDLVKDGATAIAALGQDIDTALVDLKGGTTGQVLAKASGTDLDFSWVAQDDSNAIQNAIVDAKGDLISATANDTPARLAVGTNGQVLTADSSTATGLKWASVASGGKVLQVVSNTYSTSTTVASESYADTGLSASITPTSTSSKILVLVTQSYGMARSATTVGYGLKIRRDTTDIFNGSTNYQASYFYLDGNTAFKEIYTYTNYTYLDSPSSTSSLTYKTQGRAYLSSNSGSVTFQIGSGTSTITLLEIGA